ncbi:MAG: siderophore-interacting protein [Actinomycetota bacterium]
MLVVDESGLGAAAAILDQLADHGRPLVQVIAETSDAHHTVDLTTWDGVSVRWVFRNGAAAGTGTALLDAVRDIDLDIDTTYAFGAAESRRITEVRKHLRHDAGMPAERVSMTGYWRRGLADT